MAATNNNKSRLGQVMHTKLVSTEWLRQAGAGKAGVPWWREVDAAWRARSRAAAAAAAEDEAAAQPTPTRVAPLHEPPLACSGCGGPTRNLVFMAHVAQPYWALCSACARKR